MSVRPTFAYLLLASLINSFTCQITVCTGPDQTFPHENDCTQYYICSDGNKYQLSCFNGQHFSPVTLRCEPPETAQCDPAFTPTASTPNPTGPTLPTTPSPTYPSNPTVTLTGTAAPTTTTLSS
uniref:Chitin-binding type-2 domain-containing protein n=1 Tax=Anopheles maculatus TaxID=74869 RepID=A0A182SDP5_9DIPT